MLRKDDSNKILKGVKAIVFASSLSLLSPVSVLGAEVISQSVYEEDVDDKDISTPLETLKIVGGISLVMLAVGLIGARMELTKWKKEFDNVTPVFLGPLSDNESNDNIDEAVKHLKLVNRLENNNRC